MMTIEIKLLSYLMPAGMIDRLLLTFRSSLFTRIGTTIAGEGEQYLGRKITL